MATTPISLGAAVLLLLSVSACDSPARDPAPGGSPVQVSRTGRGTVTGLAALCPGAAPRSQGNRLKVYAKLGQTTVDRQWVDAGAADSGGRYRLSLPPGEYVISAPASGDPPAAIHVRAGRSVTVDFPQRCT